MSVSTTTHVFDRPGYCSSKELPLHNASKVENCGHLGQDVSGF